MNTKSRVDCRVDRLTIPTYPEPAKEKLPMYCDHRIHQRTSGKVYPNAVVNEVVRDHKEDREYTAIYLENDFIELILLPELGGRIFSARDKSNGYDFFYRQHVIKPALIGLLGSWVSGGAEFNWPMHHRPSTFLPTDFEIEEEADGGVTVWLSEHEPLDRMKGMVGIRLTPHQALFETRAKLYNRTPQPNSFLWWENIAVPVNRDYQIFFPGDVDHVHFHYKKSVTAFPVGNSMFNGIDYRNGVRDLSWHKNTREATSYFSARSDYDFFGGFDHGRQAGVVHVANHHISPGKKMFTWAYNQLSRSWEKALTDSDGSYAELMAGVYTDNQPDFTWIEPYEMKEFSQYWYPIRDIGAPKNANTHAAINFEIHAGRLACKLYAVEALRGATLRVYCGDVLLHSETLHTAAGAVHQCDCELSADASAFVIQLVDESGRELISCRSTTPPQAELPAPTPPMPTPDELAQPEALFLAGLHLRQYREPLLNPDNYWLRAIERDPDHAPSLTALGRTALREGRLDDAVRWLRRSIAAQTRYNPNPRDGEAFHHLGIALRYLGQGKDAYAAFYKSIWSCGWRGPGYFALAQIECQRADYVAAREHLALALQSNTHHLDARNLLAAVERLTGNPSQAAAVARETLTLDRVNYGARIELVLAGALAWDELFRTLHADPSQTWIDCLAEKMMAGLSRDAVVMAAAFTCHFPEDHVSPMVHYFHGAMLERTGESEEADQACGRAREANPDYCFPSRLEEMLILRERVRSHEDPRAAYYLGNLLYGKGQRDAAGQFWELARQGGETYYVLARNLGMTAYNERRDGVQALHGLEQAMALAPQEPQLIFEWNLLMQLLNLPFVERLQKLEAHPALVRRRDDLYLELIRVHIQMGHYQQAIHLLENHTFTPCEGGEHALVELWIFAHFALGRLALRDSEFAAAADWFQRAQVFPDNLGAGIWNIAMNLPAMTGEAQAWAALGDTEKAEKINRFITGMGCDGFTTMYQPATDHYRALAFRALGEERTAQQLLERCLSDWESAKRKPDYGHFKATPFFLSFPEKPQEARAQHFDNLIGLASAALGRPREAAAAWARVLHLNSGHLWAGLEAGLLETPVPRPHEDEACLAAR